MYRLTHGSQAEGVCAAPMWSPRLEACIIIKVLSGLSSRRATNPCTGLRLPRHLLMASQGQLLNACLESYLSILKQRIQFNLLACIDRLRCPHRRRSPEQNLRASHWIVLVMALLGLSMRSVLSTLHADEIWKGFSCVPCKNQAFVDDDHLW